MLSVLSGCLGESGMGNDSHLCNIFSIDIPKGLPSNRDKIAEHVVNFSGDDWLQMD